jgi:hypothetical protein
MTLEPDAPTHSGDNRQAEADKGRRRNQQCQGSDRDDERKDNRPEISHVLTVLRNRITDL